MVQLTASLMLLAALAPRGGTQQPLRYAVDLQDTAHHVFAVTLHVRGLTTGNDVFEFAATAPGTYQTMDIGRFVRDFSAFDSTGRRIGVERIGTNEWRLAQPGRVRVIRYAVLATRDTTVTENPIYPMCGTRLEADYALINGQGVFGFPRGMQAAPLRVRLVYPAGWTMHTPLRQSGDALVAASYDQLVDSPVLLGAHLTYAVLDITGVPVGIAVRSQHGLVRAGELRGAMRGMLLAAGAFLHKLPVDRYTFLYDFDDGVKGPSGAWEHSYGSEYVLPERPFAPSAGGPANVAPVTDMAAHEFFHVVTPLNIHSEIIEHFNFTTPTPSQHLWLYEGTTEWAAQKMQLESGLKPVDAYLATVVQKFRTDRTRFDTTYSLRELSLTSYSDSGQRQYPNIYMRGAVVAGLLDIELLEESHGEHGLRDLILDLAQHYGKRRAFPEAGLIDTIVARTGPEIRGFFDHYVMRAERPPVKEMYAKLGITLIEDDKGLPLRFVVDSAPTPEQRRLREAWRGGPPPTQ